MSNEENMNLTNEPCEGTTPPDWSAVLPTGRPGYIGRTDGKNSEYRLGVNAKGSVVVNGVNLGPVADLAALVRDARRFRKMEGAHRLSPNRGWGCFPGHCEPYYISDPLAEIADALPEVEG